MTVQSDFDHCVICRAFFTTNVCRMQDVLYWIVKHGGFFYQGLFLEAAFVSPQIYRAFAVVLGVGARLHVLPVWPCLSACGLCPQVHLLHVILHHPE